MMFFKRRKQIPQSRLLAFIKRLSIVTLQLEPKSCALIQHTIRRLLTVIFAGGWYGVIFLWFIP